MSNFPAPTDFKISDILTAAFDMYAHKIGYEDVDSGYTLANHARLARSMASCLVQQYGIKPNDRVGILAQTCHSYIALWHSAMLGFFTAVPLNHRLALPELKSILANSEPKLLIYDQAHEEIATQLSENGIATLSMEDLRATILPPIENRTDVKENDVAVILYTGGTTGLPKGVVMTQKCLAVASTRLHFGLDWHAHGTCFYTTTNLFHISGIYSILGPPLMGNRVFITPSFDLPQLVRDVADYKITHMTLIGPMIDLLLDEIQDHPETHQHIKVITYGGAPVTESTIARLKTLLPDTSLTQSYAMTESLSNVTILTGADHRAGGQRLKSVGRPAPGMQIELRAPDGRTVASHGNIGEIYLKTNCLMAGYWRNNEANEAALSEGWYRTGDMGYFDNDQYLYLVDRAKDMIISGGENVYSIEVERAIGRVAGPVQVAVIGIPSEQWGEQVHAVIIPIEGQPLDSDELLKKLRNEIAGYKCPKSIEIRTNLPLTANGKIDKVALRNEHI